MLLKSDLRRTMGALCAAFAVAGVTPSLAAPTAQIGQPAPALDVKLLNGKVMKAKNLRGQVVVTMIWATWSPAARISLADVQRLYTAHHARGLEVLALSIDENVEEVRQFWRERRYSMPVGMRSDAFFDHYGRVSTTPMFYVVDRGGILRHRIAGPMRAAELEALLQPMLAASVPANLANR